MNNKDLAYLRKQFKSELTLADINKIYSVYINKDNGEVVDKKLLHFKMLDDDMRSVILANIKKVITGSIGAKLFKQNFDEELKNAQGNTFALLNNLLVSESGEDFSSICDYLVTKLKNNFVYKTSIVMNFYRVKILTEMNGFDFIICTTNKVESSKQNYVYDYAEREFMLQNRLDAIVTMEAPYEGFMYPVFEDDSIDMDNVLEYNPKYNSGFTYGVLECTTSLTAKQEKECFHQIISEVTDGNIEPDKLKNIYKVIDERFADKDDKLITPGMLQNVLNDLDIEPKKDLKEAYTETVADETYTFNVESILPNLDAKSVQLENTDIEIKVKPGNLDKVAQIRNSKGQVFALIKLDENLITNGMNITINSIDELNRIIEG
jgi:hypothetical protein